MVIILGHEVGGSNPSLPTSAGGSSAAQSACVYPWLSLYSSVTGRKASKSGEAIDYGYLVDSEGKSFGHAVRTGRPWSKSFFARLPLCWLAWVGSRRMLVGYPTILGGPPQEDKTRLTTLFFDPSQASQQRLR